MPRGGSTPNRALVLAPFSPKLAVTDHLLQGQHQNRMDIANVMAKAFVGGMKAMEGGMNTLAKTYAVEDTRVIHAHLELGPICSQGGNDVSLECSALFSDRLSSSAPSSQKKMPARDGSNPIRGFHCDDHMEIDDDDDEPGNVGEAFARAPTDAKASLAAIDEQ